MYISVRFYDISVRHASIMKFNREPETEQEIKNTLPRGRQADVLCTTHPVINHLRTVRGGPAPQVLFLIPAST